MSRAAQAAAAPRLHGRRRNGAFGGFPSLGVTYQTLESPVMRAYFHMQDHHKGVLICSVAPLAPAHGVLQKDDILLRFDGVQIANDGTVPFRRAPCASP